MNLYVERFYLQDVRTEEYLVSLPTDENSLEVWDKDIMLAKLYHDCTGPLGDLRLITRRRIRIDSFYLRRSPEELNSD